MSIKLLAKHNKIHPISLNELFTESFMIKYTKFSNLADFFKAGNFTIKSQRDINCIRKNLNFYVSSTTQFSSWQNMLYKAGEEFIIKILEF